ncbi:hypothetical protein RN001_004076 [Aquatica leii]|uniref:AB hydrolase-1 domain-containing protein n=1 Tax=Aquatica leii TaxID=1421715 RepID=A0AAN7ST53_9COLE|nr:hypothetical protein RN001_004076 [Aquatica leii]
MKIKELEFLVPWGHIAAKTWGDDKNKLVLMLHGASDNAGSFDRLIPFLPAHFYYVCLDLPGHGKSSHFPKDTLVQDMNIIMSLKIVIDTLNAKKIILIGHSWGGQTACLFTQLYPEFIEKLVIIESVCYAPISIEYFKQFTTEYIKDAINILEKAANSSPPTYTYENALEVIMNGRIYGKLNKEAAKAIAQRSLKKVDNDQYVITNDVRNRIRYCFFLDKGYVEKLFETHLITCPVLFLFARYSIPLRDYYKNILTQVKRTNKKCIIKELLGDHDMHNNTPELVAPEINNFLNTFNSNL